MSTIKISQLTQLTDLDANTSNTLFLVDTLTSNITATVSATVLAQHLFSNNALLVGQNPILFPNTVAQLSNTDSQYIQVNIQNFSPNGSSDLVLTADNGDNTNSFVDLGINNSQWNPSVFGQTAQYPYDGYLMVDGPLNTPKGNLVIGTANPSTNLVFSIGGLTSSNVPAVMTANGLVFKTSRYLTFADNTQQTTAGAPLAYTQAAFDVANTANASITYVSGVNLAQNTYASAAFAKANSALANTSGTFAGNLSVTGDLSLLNGSLSSSGNMTVNGTMILANSNFTSSQAALVIKATPTTALPSNDGYMLHISGKQNVASRIVFDSYSANGVAYGLVAGRTARGSVTAPTATQNTDVLMRISGNGYGTTGWAPLGVARIDIVAAENYTDSARGSIIKFYNMPIGSNVVQEIASFNADTINFTGIVNPQKGFSYAPRTFAAAQTAVTIDFANNVVLKANCAADITFSFTNYTAGKQVEVWLTNTSGSQRVVTHGCSALNSTINSTTFNLPATSSAWLKYYCVNGDLANTFVTVNHA